MGVCFVSCESREFTSRKSVGGKRDVANWGEWNTCDLRAEEGATKGRRPARYEQEGWGKVAGKRH